MREMARKMADVYCVQMFRDDLPIIAGIVAKNEGVDLSA